MAGNQVFLAAEDRMGLAFGRSLLAEQSLGIWRFFDAGGCENLRCNINKYNEMARNGLPVLLLTDLDEHPCGGELINSWLGRKPEQDLLIRVCVRESEAWLLADPAPLANLFKLPVSKFPLQPESLPDPKAELLRLASKAPHKVRKALHPAKGSSARVGIEYNDILCSIVAKQWNMDIATRLAPSLAKARMRISELAKRISSASKNI